MRARAGSLRGTPQAQRGRVAIWRTLAGGCALVAALVGVLAWPGTAHAQVALPVEVEREAGADDCPDSAALIARIQKIVGPGARLEATPYRVTFSRGPQAYSAAIRLGSDGATVRYLQAREPSCASLAHATAIALAVLFDADTTATGSEENAPENAAEEKTAPPLTLPPVTTKPRAADNDEEEEERRPVSRSSARVDPWFALGASALVGVLRPIVPAFVADAGLEVQRFHASAGAVWALPQDIPLPPGSAHEKLLSGNVRACFALAYRESSRFDLCSGVLAGMAKADASGFTETEQHTELFLAFPAELSFAGRSRFIGLQAGAAALVLAPPNQFEVEGVGPTYRPAKVAGMFTLRVFFVPTR